MQIDEKENEKENESENESNECDGARSIAKFYLAETFSSPSLSPMSLRKGGGGGVGE